MRLTGSKTQKQSVLSGVGICNGNSDDCTRGFALSATGVEKSNNNIPPTYFNKRQDPCKDLNTTILFDMCDNIFVSQLLCSMYLTRSLQLISTNAKIHAKTLMQ